ncbi:MAG: hypothetical protein Q4B70_12630 [Lachnospiraceae bacterium]|nr:hypothetical protein [Lachnospiraceae bacterium]
MKKFYLLLVACIFAFILFYIGMSNGNKDGFIEMESYIGGEEGEQFDFCLNYFCKGRPMEGKTIKSIQFPECEKMKNTFSMEYVSRQKWYGIYAVTLSVIFPETGTYSVKKIVIQYEDNTTKEYDVGSIFFDIDEKNNQDDWIDTWSSPAASSNKEEFTFDYKLKNASVKIKKIIYGENEILEDSDGISPNSAIELTGDAPIKIIRPKIIVEYKGEEQTYYGMPCNCGALDVDSSVLP